MDLERELLTRLENDLRALPRVKVRRVRREHRVLDRPMGDLRVDLELLAEIHGRPARIVVEAKSVGYPRDIREVAWQLKRIQQSEEDDAAAYLVAAPAISPTSREMLQEQGLGYWDAGGSLHLEVPWAVYHVDRSALRMERRRAESPFRGRAAQVVHALLMEPRREWKVQELAERAEVSAFTAHKVLSYLEGQLWVEKEGAGPKSVRHLRDPGMLLDAWAKTHSLDRYGFHRFHRWTQSPDLQRERVAGTLEKLGIEYALTLTSGAELVAPYATGIERLTLLVPESADLGRVAQKAGLKAVEEGENVLFLTTREHWPLMFRQRVDGVWMASPVQLYLDLWAWPMRGKEQAQHLRSELLRF